MSIYFFVKAILTEILAYKTHHFIYIEPKQDYQYVLINFSKGRLKHPL